MTSRAFAIALALLLSAQAIAAGGTVMVCRYTGKVLVECPCPESQDGPATLSKESCCELRGSAPMQVTAVVPFVDQAPLVGWIAIPAPTYASVPVVSARPQRIHFAQGPPLPDGRYLRLRSLLL